MKDLTGTFIAETKNSSELIVIEKASKRSAYFHLNRNENSRNYLEEKELQKELKGVKLIRLGGVTRGPKREKPLSRAGRLGVITNTLGTIQGEIEALISDFEAQHPSIDEAPDGEQQKFVDAVNEQIGAIDYSEVEELKDEIQNWRDNLPESLQNGSKADDLDQCISDLESGQSELENISEISSPSEAQEAVDNIETAINSLGDVSFPGMFG